MTRKRPYPPEYEAYAREVGLRLQRLRVARSLTHRQVANITGVSENAYQLLEGGRSKPGTPLNPQLRTLIKLSQAFGVTAADLLPEGAPDLTEGRPKA